MSHHKKKNTIITARLAATDVQSRDGLLVATLLAEPPFATEEC